jgi:hypothetical protein
MDQYYLEHPNSVCRDDELRSERPVADPRIAESPANSLDTMRLLNLFCKVVETAAG